MKHRFFFLVVTTIICTSFVSSQATVKESSTGKMFPATITFNYSGKEYSVSVTGLTVRKKLFFKVYGIAHYMEDAPKVNNEEDAFDAILKDGKAKQITMDFSRDVDAASIKDAYANGFKEHASGEELKKIGPLLDQFIGYFTNDVKEHEQFTLRWLPGGVIIANLQGVEKPAIAGELFARLLWTIWFGKDSIVDRDELVEKMVQ